MAARSFASKLKIWNIFRSLSFAALSHFSEIQVDNLLVTSPQGFNHEASLRVKIILFLPEIQLHSFKFFVSDWIVRFSLRLRISEFECVWSVEKVHVVFLWLRIVNSVESWVDSLEGVNLEFIHLVLSGQTGSSVFLVDHVPKGTSRPTGSQSTEHSKVFKYNKNF